MTIKIQAYQKHGIKSDKVEDEFEFCCWIALRKWLNNWGGHLYDCPKCQKAQQKPKPSRNYSQHIFSVKLDLIKKENLE